MKPIFMKTIFLGLIILTLGMWVISNLNLWLDNKELKQETYVQLKPVTYLSEPDNTDYIHREMLLEFMYKHSVMPKSVLNDILSHVMNSTRPELLLAIMKKESHYDPHQIGEKTKYGYARGLGQVMYSIWRDELRQFNITSDRCLFEVGKQVHAISYIISVYIKATKGDIPMALGRYYGAQDSGYINPILKDYVTLTEYKNHAKFINQFQIDRGYHGYNFH